MSNDTRYIPFSQRNGYAEIPPQLKIGQASPELRRLIDYALQEEVARVERISTSAYFDGDWLRVSKDFHVRFLRKPASSYDNSPARLRGIIAEFCVRADIAHLFDLVEFFTLHNGTTDRLKSDLSDIFVEARAAYRLVDGLVMALGTEEQAYAVEAALTAAEAFGAKAARSHLVSAGTFLRHGDWAGSIRESIHAVESLARQLDPDAKTLGPALKKLESRGHLHPSLKNAFSSLYGYTNDEKGVRHANVFDDTPNVDETDALFMLGACASFVSYLVARNEKTA